MLETVRDAVPATLLTALPAELVTLERPCCACPATCEALSFAFVAAEDALLAASEVVDAARRWTSHLDWRSASRGSMGEDMVGEV